MSIYQAIVPSFMGVNVTSRRKLVYLGWWNLRHILHYHSREKRDTISAINTMKKTLREVDGKTIKDVRENAICYENPTLQVDLSYSGVPIPVDPGSRHRKPGETTLNYCGWCNYCTTFTTVPVCGDCKITGWCNIEHRQVQFDTKCLLKSATNEKLRECAKRIKHDIRDAEAKKAKTAKYTEYVVKAMQKTEIKPPFANWRPSDYFSVNQNLICFFPEKGFVSIEVLCTTSSIVVFTIPQLNKQHEHQRYVHNPDIMGEWEFEYLKKHPDYRSLWLKTSNASDRMIAAFAAIE